MPAKYTPEQQVEAFHARVDRSGGPDACHPWTGCRRADGYGRVGWDGRKEGAHRIAYILAHGPIPADKPCVCHRCDVKLCCNGAHLFAGTHADNNADRDAKGRRVAGRAFGDRNASRLYPERRPRGEMVVISKLKAADIPPIRAALAAKESKASIARRYGVSGAAIYAIAIGETWAHIPEEAHHGDA